MKLTFNLDATALGHSACILDLYRTVIGSEDENGMSEGGYKPVRQGASMMYGIAVHKFVDLAFKSKGDLVMARRAAHKMFDKIPANDPPKGKDWLRDARHLDVTCFNLWNDFIMEDDKFQLIELVQPCWLCKGEGIRFEKPCVVCNGIKNTLQPASEITFSIKYYEDDYIIVNLCGTIDKVGKFKNGAYAIGDWKTTSAWDNIGYFQQYELSRQLRVYSLAFKLMSVMHPDSVLGTIGATGVSCFIDAIFLKKEPNDTKFERSEIFPIRPADLDAFQLTLDDKIRQLSQAIKTGYIPKEGILNGVCVKQYGKCAFWDCCRHPDNVSELLLKRNFKRVVFNPLKYNDI